MSLSILVADDEQLAAQLLAENLTDMGFAEVGVVYTAETALEYIERKQPDLVFLDVNFNTDMTGMDVVRRVNKSVPETLFCLMSGYRDDCKAEAQLLGTLAFIGKPARMEEYTAVAVNLAKGRP